MSRKKKTKSERLQPSKAIDINGLKNIYIEAQRLQQHGYLNQAEKLYLEILNYIPDQSDALHYLGLIYMQKGNDKQAEACIKRSIETSGNPFYFSNYGMLLSKNGKHDQAIKQYRKAIELQPQYAEAWFNLGTSLFSMSELVEAEGAFNRAIECRKDYIKAIYSLACVQDAQGNYDEARKTINKIQSITPVSATDYYTLAMALQLLGGSDNIRQAREYLKKALKLSPQSLEIYIALGQLLYDSNNMEAAIGVFKDILVMEPDYQDVKLKYADCLVKNDQIADAEIVVSDILEKNPENIMAQLVLANIKMMKGDFVAVDNIYGNILKADPNNSDAIASMANSRKVTDRNDPLIEKLQNISGKKKSPSVLYALGKIFNDLGDYDEAFSAYKEANDIKNRKLEYDYKEHSNYIDKVISIFNKDFIDNLAVYGNRTELPVFIVGSPRSGTTLTEQIISSHPFSEGAGELKYLGLLANKGIEINKPGNSFPDRIQNISSEDIKNEAQLYLEKIARYRISENIVRITDKMPGNFYFIGYIFILFPNAKIIHCKRNALDSCLSMYFQAFQESHQYSFSLENLGYWYKNYLRLMKHWRNIFGEKILDVYYDDTVNNTEESARRLISYCGLDWSEKCLEFYKNTREIKTASIWQARQPIYRTSLERWRRYDKHIGILKEILAGEY